MSRLSYTRELMDAYAVRKITSSTNATPIVVTFNNHNLVDDDKITINGHLTNTNANGVWTITKVTDNTFSLNDSVGNGAGSNTGAFAKTKGMSPVTDYKACILSFDTDGGGDAAMTVKLVGSIQVDEPDFAAPKTADNQYEFIFMVDLEDPTNNNIAGDTGVVSTTDVHRMFEANINGLKWLGVLPTAGTEGEITVAIRKFTNS